VTDAPAVRSARPDILDDTARSWQQVSADLDHEISAWKNGVIAPLRDEWQGSAADAADTVLNRRARDLIATREYADAMATVLRDAATGIDGAQALLRTADHLAAAHGLVISNDGTASWPPASFSLGGLVTQAEELFQSLPPAAAEATATAQRALALADQTDQQVTARLEKIGLFEGASTGNTAPAAAMLAGAGALGATLASAVIPPRGSSPASTAAWWKGLTDAERQRLIDEAPSRIGWLDGLPATVRSEANILAMQREKTQVTAELQALNAHKPPAADAMSSGPRNDPQPSLQWRQWWAKNDALQQQLAQINGLEGGLKDAAAKTGQQPYLLGFDTNGEGHAIVAIGNPDTATNTITYVPGLGSHLSGSSGDISRARVMWQNASKYASPGQKVSSVYWLNYDAPQMNLGIGQVAGTGAAVAGASNLTQFQAGLGAAHHPGVVDHTTLIGHSYGSLVVGEAAARDHLHPTDIIFVGSPGVGVNHASQLGIPPSHVWAGANAHDPVPRLPSPVNVPGIVTGSPAEPVIYATTHDQGWFGTNPATGPFGGQTFDATTDRGRSFLPLDFTAHSAYWDPNSSSLFNMAHIAVGKYPS
jgi:hypothetical protein